MDTESDSNGPVTERSTASGDPVAPRPALALAALREALATAAPARLPEFFEAMQNAFVRAGEENTALPIHMFYRQWAMIVEIERFPGVAARLHAAERALGSADPEVRATAIREAGEIVRQARDEVAGGLPTRRS